MNVQKKLFLLFLGLGCLCLACCASAQVPIKMINGLPHLEARINGKGPYLFGFDTGFGGAIELDSAMAHELGIKTSGSIEIGDPSGRNNQILLTGTMAFLELDGKTFTQQEVILRPGRLARTPGVVGILGMNLFEAYTLTLDYPQQQFGLEKKELPSSDNQHILDYVPVGGGIPQIALQVGTETIRAAVDSRSTSGYFKLPETLAKKMHFANEPKLIGRARTISSDIPINQVNLSESIRFGQFEYKEPTITYPSFSEEGIIGAQILKDFAISIDQKNQRIRFVKPQASSAANAASTAHSQLNEYTGTYGDRVITLSEGALFIQRPGGMLLKMVPKTADEFTLEKVPQAVLKFERNPDQKIIAIKVVNQQGQWETAPKNS